MSKINDGTEPAFGGRFYPGMSLRDYLAAQALVAMGQHVPSHFPNGSPVGVSSIAHPMATEARAEWAYQQADAMLDEREITGGALRDDLSRFERSAVENADGHLSLFRFTTGWKATLGTPVVTPDPSLNDVGDLPAFPTAHEAIMWAIGAGRAAEGGA